MTVATETDKTGPLPCNGATTVFNYLFRILDEDDLEVILTDSAGAETVLTKTTHYTVTGVGDAAGGSITTVSTYASGNTITLVRNPDLVQEVDLQNQGAFLAESIERALDRATMQVQKAYGAAARGLRVPKSDASASLEIPTVATRAGKALIFDDDGNATAGGVPDVAVSAPMYPVVQAVDLATARTEFGLGDLSTLDAVGTAQITDEAVTLAKMADLAQDKLIGRATASTGVPEAVGLDSTLAMASGNLKVVDASETQKGAVEKAAIAEVIAETADKYADAASLKHHPGVAKFWANFNGTGTPAIRSSYNVSGITDHGTGLYSILIDTDLANGDYAPFAMGGRGVAASTATIVTIGGADPTGAALRVVVSTPSTIYDAEYITVGGFGAFP